MEVDHQREKEETRRKSQMATLLDDDHLIEQRWPFLSERKKVQSTAPPAFSEPAMKVSDTRANLLRSMVVRKNKKKGKYASGEER